MREGVMRLMITLMIVTSFFIRYSQKSTRIPRLASSLSSFSLTDSLLCFSFLPLSSLSKYPSFLVNLMSPSLTLSHIKPTTLSFRSHSFSLSPYAMATSERERERESDQSPSLNVSDTHPHSLVSASTNYSLSTMGSTSNLTLHFFLS